MNPRPKKKRTRLKGDKLGQLYANVFHRDKYVCQKCFRWTAQPHPHHKILRSQGGEDVEENLLTMCYICHHWAHYNPLKCKEWINERNKV